MVSSEFSISRIVTPELLGVMENLPFPLSYAELAEDPPRIAFINKAFRQLFGYRLEEISTLDDWARLAYPDEGYRHEVMERWTRDAEQAFKHGGVVPTREVEIQSRDGEPLRVLLNGSFIGSSVVVAFVDISEQARAEAELRDVRYELERTAYELTENLPVGTYTMVQPPEGGLAQFKFLSSRFIEITGLSRDEVYADPLRAFTCIHPDDYERWLALNRQAFENKAPFFGEARLTTRDTLRWISAESKPRILSDGSTIWEGVVIDITERKLAEESLARAKERAEQLEQVKTDFLARMSHEIRTPLTVILGLADLLEDEFRTPTASDKLLQLRNAGNLLLGIVNDVLDLSKIEAGELLIEKSPFSLNDVLSQLRGFHASIVNPELSLVFAPYPEQLPRLIGDQRRLEQVMGNLVGNAIKFTERGTVTVAVRVLDRTVDTLRLRFSVDDTGIGVALDQQRRLFEPFMQGETGLDRHPGGSGLGLSISKELVELMGGTIGMHSTPGQGSTFWVELAFAIAADAACNDGSRNQGEWSALSRETAPTRLDGIKILVVEDSLSIRGLIRAFLVRAGASVVLAENGAIALEMLETQDSEIDCVMMDIQMSVMDGLTATRRIRANPALADLPVLAMTAGLLAEQQQRAREAGVSDVVAKPIIPAQMLNKIRSAVLRLRPSALTRQGDANPIPVIHGIDRSHAMQTMGGSLEMFDMLVGIFVEEYGNFCIDLNALLADYDRPKSGEKAARLVHSLCGSSAQIGAVAVSQTGQVAYDALVSQHRDTAQAVASLCSELDALLIALRAYQKTG